MATEIPVVELYVLDGVLDHYPFITKHSEEGVSVWAVGTEYGLIDGRLYEMGVECFLSTSDLMQYALSKLAERESKMEAHLMSLRKFLNGIRDEV